MTIIDRRVDPGGKSLANRQRFIRKARAAVRQAVREASAGRGIRDIDKGGAVSVPVAGGGLGEPSFRAGEGSGRREHVLPGNRDYVGGDRIARPKGGAGGGGSQGSADGEGEDSFRFVLSREEFLDFFLEDLELPNMAKRQIVGVDRETRTPAGFRTAGPPSALSVTRTLRRSLARRLALGRPRTETLEEKLREVEALEGEEDEDAVATARAELDALRRRRQAVPYVDPVDLRFRRTEARPEPIARAVMFCLMDVSGSMDEHMKDLAKRFFSLLYLFLSRRYRRVEIVFVRHTHEAREVDEETFFGSRETGGTIVSSALDEMLRIVAARYPPGEWNIYAAQASDGDNLSSDNAVSVEMLRSEILPLVQHYVYMQVGRDESGLGWSGYKTGLWRAYETLLRDGVPMAMRKVATRGDIYPVFRELFARRADASPGEGG